MRMRRRVVRRKRRRMGMRVIELGGMVMVVVGS